MQKNRRSTWIISLIYAAAAILSIALLIILEPPGPRLRFIVTVVAVLAAEIAVYGYALFWLGSARRNRNASPLLISGAWITGVYASAVIIAAVLLDWGLQLQPLIYMTVQLTLLLAGIALLAVTGLYGRNAAAGERRSADAARAHRQHQAELQDIRELAGSWRNPGAPWLTELVAGLEEQFRYSDPLTRPDLHDTEDMLTRQISLLHDQVALLLALRDPGSDWENTASELADSISGTLQRRNRELAALK